VTSKSPADAPSKVPTTRTETGHFTSTDGTRLYFEYDRVEAPKAALLILHGFADHLGRYAGMAAHFNALGYDTYRFDYRGHGRADGRRGHIYAFAEYLSDFEAFRAHAGERIGKLPRFVCAHSNGGLIATHGVAADPSGLAGLCLSSPFFGISAPVPAWKSVAGKLLSRVIPALALPTDINPEHVSHDPAVIAGYGTDTLVGKVASARWFTEILAAHGRSAAVAAGLKLPVLVQQAGDDRIADAKASRRVFEAMGSADKTFTDYAGLYHELWFEADRARTLGDLATWLEAHQPTDAA
jgi:alpha-beta hydrolase superfamily lysophospholipase